MFKREITTDRNRTMPHIVYTNSKGNKHRTRGPACIWFNGSINWLENDRFHRKNKPAWIFSTGYTHYWMCGVRKDGI